MAETPVFRYEMADYLDVGTEEAPDIQVMSVFENIDESLLFDLPQIAEDEEAFISLTELRYEYFKAVGDEEQAKKYKRRFEELKNEYID